MKKIFCLVVVVFSVIANFQMLYASDGMKIFVDRQEVVFDQAPVIYEGRTLIPMRAVSEALGASVDYVFDEEKSIVTAVKDGVFIEFFLGEEIARVNSEEVLLDAAPQIVGDRAMVPLRFISESFGLSVVWDEADGNIYIYSEIGDALGHSRNEEQKQALADAWDSLIGGEEAREWPKRESGAYSWEREYTIASNYTVGAGSISGVENAKTIPIDTLVQIAGFIEDVYISSDENEPSYIFVESSGIVWAARFMGNMFDEQSVGQFYYLFGTFEGVNTYFGFEAPMLYILRDIDAEENLRTHRLSSFYLAPVMEGESLTDPKEIEKFLNENYADYAYGAPYFVFNIVRNAEFDYTLIVRFNENHELGNALRFANISDKQREEVRYQLQKYMLMLANGLTQKCPDINFKGYYYDAYSVIFEGETRVYEMRFASWTNDIGEVYNPESGNGFIKWLPQLDFDWVLKQK